MKWRQKKKKMNCNSVKKDEKIKIDKIRLIKYNLQKIFVK